MVSVYRLAQTSGRNAVLVEDNLATRQTSTPWYTFSGAARRMVVLPKQVIIVRQINTRDIRERERNVHLLMRSFTRYSTDPGMYVTIGTLLAITL